MKKRFIIAMFIVLIYASAYSQELTSNFRIGVSYNTLYSHLSNEQGGIGLHGEVYIPIKAIKNVQFLIGGISTEAKLENYGEEEDYDGHQPNLWSNFVGGYLGLRSSVGKSFGFECSAGIGYFSYRQSINQSSEPSTNYVAGSSFGGIFSAGPFINISKAFNLSINGFAAGNGGENAAFSSLFGFRLLLGSSF